MTINKQNQKAGDNSQQYQDCQIIVNSGLDEKRAKEIFDEEIDQALTIYTDEASEIARERINRFADDLIPRLVRNDLLDALKDPSIQLLLIDAQKTAAASEREDDYGILSELLVHRAKNNSDRGIRSSVNRAVKIVDEISDEALLGLTIAYSILCWVPQSGIISEGLDTLDALYTKLIYDSLPEGNDWIEHLEVLDCVRIIDFFSSKKLHHLCSEHFPGYIDVGIERASENYNEALTIIKDCGLHSSILTEHELRPGYVRLPIKERSDIECLKLVTENHEEIPLNDEQKISLNKVYSLYNNDDVLRNQNVETFMKKWNEHNSLRKLTEWWDTIPSSFSITPVGRVLAHANAQKCDSSLPPLD